MAFNNFVIFNDYYAYDFTLYETLFGHETL